MVDFSAEGFLVVSDSGFQIVHRNSYMVDFCKDHGQLQIAIEVNRRVVGTR